MPSPSTVVAGLVPAIRTGAKDVDARDKPGHDDPTTGVLWMSALSARHIREDRLDLGLQRGRV